MKGVTWISQNIHFDYDKNVSVFETNIRVLGGLLSAHLIGEELPHSGYNGELFTLIIDLAKRLLKAFDTPTGIPYGTVLFFLIIEDQPEIWNSTRRISNYVHFRDRFNE